MKKTKYTFGFLLVICMIVFNVKLMKAQGNSSSSVEYPIEKVNLMTDRNLYISGETVWFTASCFLIESSSPHNISKVLYIELYNAENKIFNQEKFILTNGRVSGFIHIPEELPTDNYFLRAYTMYLRNFSPDIYATLCLTIINPEFPPQQAADKEGLEVFSENEKLVAGVQNRLAIRVPVVQSRKITGAGVYDTSGVFAAPVKFFNNGLGSFAFVPEDNATYFLKLEFENKDSLIKKLPVVKQGWIATSRISSDRLRYRLSGKGHPENRGSFQFSVWSQDQRLLFRQEFNLENLQIGIEIRENILVPGINYLVLKSGDGELISFTSCLVQHQFDQGPEIRLEKQSFRTREKVELQLLPFYDDNEAVDYMQLSVVKAGTNFDLDSTLPDVYLENPLLLRDALDQPLPPDVNDQIDAVLVIQNSRLKNEFLQNKNALKDYSDYIPEIRDISVSGIVKEKKNGNPIPAIRVYAAVLHDDFQFHSTTSTTDGSFVFSLPHLQGKHDLFLTTEVDSSVDIEILLNNDFSAQFPNLMETLPEINIRNRTLIEELLVNQQVSMNFPAFSEMRMEPVTALPPWIRTDVITIVLSDYIPLATIQEVFNEIVTWVRMKEKNGVYKLSVFDDQSQLTYDDPMVLLDGIPITDVNVLTKLYPAQVDQIKVLNRVYILGDLTIRGLISIKTKTDNFGGISLPDNAVFVNYKTRSVPALFKLPDELPADLKKPNPWFKTLLYYESIDSLTAKGKSIEFFTSDQTSEYDIILKGKTRDGKLIFSKHSFDVKD